MNDSPNRAEGDVDRIVHQRFFSPGVSAGRVFVDVGAARPDFLSIGAYYRSLGWRVIGIEANPEFCKLHRDRGHEIYQYACGQHDEDDVDFTVVDSHGGMGPMRRLLYCDDRFERAVEIPLAHVENRQVDDHDGEIDQRNLSEADPGIG